LHFVVHLTAVISFAVSLAGFDIDLCAGVGVAAASVATTKHVEIKQCRDNDSRYFRLLFRSGSDQENERLNR